MQRAVRALSLAPGLKSSKRGFCSSPTTHDKLVASVLFERLPVIIPKMEPIVYAFKEYTFRWDQQYRVEYPEKYLTKSDSSETAEENLIEYVPAPRITEADKTNDTKSLNRALDERLYLLLYGPTFSSPNGKPVWHFPEKVYEAEENMRKCAESALKSVIGDLSRTYFVGNAPMAHMVVEPSEDDKKLPSFKRFFFKSMVAGKKYNVGGCDDFMWATKAEILELFPEHAELLNKMIILVR